MAITGPRTDVTLGHAQSVSLDQDGQSITILGDDCTVFHRGGSCSINNAEDEYIGDNAVIMTSDSGTNLSYTGKVKAFIAGEDADLGVGLGGDAVTDGAEYFSAGDRSGAFVYDHVKNTLIVMSGDNASVEDTMTTEAAFPRDERNTIILTGKESDVRTGYPGDTLIVTGNESRIEMQAKWLEETQDVQGGLAFIGGKDCSVETGTDSAFYCAYSPEEIVFNENSMAVIGWHDGTRERASVFYEGENGVKAGVKYTMDSNGQLIPL